MNESNLDEEVREHRSPKYEIAPMILNRWSARSMTGESLSKEELMSLFEAARWAPSSRNNQPWRYRYAKRESDDWEVFYDLLSEGNKQWAKDAAALIIVLSKTAYENGKPIQNNSFSTGASWENLALEGARRGLVVHPMAGFNDEAARAVLNIPDCIKVEIMTAVGVPGPREKLSEYNRSREYPSDRKPLDEIVGEGKFEP